MMLAQINNPTPKRIKYIADDDNTLTCALLLQQQLSQFLIKVTTYMYLLVYKNNVAFVLL